MDAARMGGEPLILALGKAPSASRRDSPAKPSEEASEANGIEGFYECRATNCSTGSSLAVKCLRNGAS
jgi:hypothetical protein